jgi:fructose-1,6-bisphosphatase/inositol monophosphatase family enzyme
MNNLQQEKDFFHFIAGEVRNLVANSNENMTIAQHKKEGDFSTQVDIDVENLIVSEIKKDFPKIIFLLKKIILIPSFQKGKSGLLTQYAELIISRGV